MAAFRRALAALVAVGLTAAACQDFTDVTPEPESASLSIALDIGGSSIQIVVAEIAAPDIDPPIVDTLQAHRDTVSGILTVPAGSGRVLTLHGFDSYDVETHRGTDTLTIQPGSNPPVTVILKPLTGEIEVIGVLGDLPGHSAGAPSKHDDAGESSRGSRAGSGPVQRFH